MAQLVGADERVVNVSFEHFTRRTFDASDDFDAGVAEHVCEVVVDPAGDNGADAQVNEHLRCVLGGKPRVRQVAAVSDNPSFDGVAHEARAMHGMGRYA